GGVGALAWVVCVAFSPDGKILASGTYDSTVKLWDVPTGKERATLEGFDNNEGIDSLGFSPDGRTLACVDYDNLYIFDMARGKKAVQINPYADGIRSAEFPPDGRLLALCGRYAATVRVWEFRTVPSGKD